METKIDFSGGGQQNTSGGGVSMDDFNPGLLLYILNNSIIWIILSVVITVTISFLYLRYTPRIYESSTKLILKTEKSTQILGIQGLVFEKDMSEVNREMQMIKSPIMIGTICDSLKLNIGYFKEGKSKFIVEEIYKSSPFKIEGELIDYNISNVPIYLKIINKSKFLISYNADGQDVENEYRFGQALSTKHFSGVISLKNNTLTPDEINAIYFFKFYDRSYAINLITSKINITPIEGKNNTLEIFCKDQSPEKARDILKILAREFIIFDVKKKRESFDNITAFIDAQMDSFGRAQEIMQDSLSRFKIQNELFGEESSYDKLLENMYTLQNEMLQTEGKLFSIQNFKEIIQKTKDYTSLPSLRLKDTDLNIEGDIERINRSQQSRETKLLDVTEDHPEIRTIDRQILAAIVATHRKCADEYKQSTRKAERTLPANSCKGVCLARVAGTT